MNRFEGSVGVSYGTSDFMVNLSASGARGSPTLWVA